MSIFLRGKTYWYKFRWSVKAPDGKRESYEVRRSARTSNLRKAENQEGDHKTALRRGEIHPLDPFPKVKPPASEPFTLLQYAEVVLRHVELYRKPGTVQFYRECLQRIEKFPPLAQAPIDTIQGNLIDAYTEWRLAAKRGNSPYAINAELRTLRRILYFAEEKNVIQKAPTVHQLSEPEGRIHPLSPQQETAYLRAAGPRLRQIAIVAADTGLRPQSELFPLRWENVGESFIRVIKGKTPNAPRIVPLTPRAKAVLETLRSAKNGAPWVFPAKKSTTGHLVTIQKAHERTVKAAKLEPFPFYAFRHLFGTRCAESGMDKFAIARLMGHSSPAVAERYYIKVSPQHVEANFERFVEYQTRQQIEAYPQPSGQVQ